MTSATASPPVVVNLGGSSWTSYKIISGTLARSLGTSAISYREQGGHYLLARTAGRKVIFLTPAASAYLKTVLSLSPLARTRIMYVSSTCVYKYGLLQRWVENLGGRFVHPSHFHATEMKKMGFRNVMCVPHACPDDFELPVDTIRRLIRERRAKRHVFTIFTSVTSNGTYKGLPQFALALSRSRAKCKVVVHVASGSTSVKDMRKDVNLIEGHLSRREMIDRILQSDLVVVPSLIEGFGLVIVESMRLGRPVLTIDAPPMNETNRTGYLVKVDRRATIDSGDCIDFLNYPNIEDFAQKLEEAIEDRWWEERALSALNLACAEYDSRLVYGAFKGPLVDLPATR